MNLDIGLPTEHLRQPIRKCLSGESSAEKLQLPATNRRGRPVRLAVTCAPFALGKNPTWGALIAVEEQNVSRRRQLNIAGLIFRGGARALGSLSAISDRTDWPAAR